jgi:hypothetical protein
MAGFRNNFGITGGFRTTFRVTDIFQKAGTSSLKRVTGRIFNNYLLTDFFILDVLYKKTAKHCIKPSALIQKVSFDFFRTSKKYSSCKTLEI